MKIKNARNHKIIDIEDVWPLDDSETNININEITCLEHSSFNCVLYCIPCEQFICTKCVTKIQNGHDAVDEDEYKAELYTLLEIQRETEIKLIKLALSRFARGKVKIHQFAVEGNEIKRKQSAKLRAISTQTLQVIY